MINKLVNVEQEVILEFAGGSVKGYITEYDSTLNLIELTEETPEGKVVSIWPLSSVTRIIREYPSEDMRKVKGFTV